MFNTLNVRGQGLLTGQGDIYPKKYNDGEGGDDDTDDDVHECKRNSFEEDKDSKIIPLL